MEDNLNSFDVFSSLQEATFAGGSSKPPLAQLRRLHDQEEGESLLPFKQDPGNIVIHRSSHLTT